MSKYFGFIPLSEAKAYLRVEHDESDVEIGQMLDAACNLVEEKTCVLLYARDKIYRLRNQCVHIYDGPINTEGITGLPETMSRYDFSNYTVFQDSNVENTTFTLNVGHSDSEEVPFSLRQAVLQMLDYWYYKNDGKVSMTLLDSGAMEAINTYSRFLI